MGEILNGTYQVDSLTETVVNGVPTATTKTLQTDGFSSNQTWIGFNFGASYAIFTSKEKEKKAEEIAAIVVPIKKDTVITIEKDPKITLPTRPVKVTRKFKVVTETVRIEVFDGSVEDGDTISLILNGQVILHEFGLTKKKHKFDIQLKEGVNTLVLFAHNLGRIKPNTARVYVIEGKKKHIMTVRSNLGESGAVEINYTPKIIIEEDKK
jgi:hypothetical protein